MRLGIQEYRSYSMGLANIGWIDAVVELRHSFLQDIHDPFHRKMGA